MILLLRKLWKMFDRHNKAQNETYYEEKVRLAKEIAKRRYGG